MPYNYRQLDNHASATPKSGTSTSKYPSTKRPASHQRQIAVNKAIDKKALELGGIQGKIGITRNYAKKSGESEFEWMKRGVMDSGVGGVINIGKGIGKGLSKIQNKAGKKKK